MQRFRTIFLMVHDKEYENMHLILLKSARNIQIWQKCKIYLMKLLKLSIILKLSLFEWFTPNVH